MAMTGIKHVELLEDRIEVRTSGGMPRSVSNYLYGRSGLCELEATRDAGTTALHARGKSQ